MVVTHPDFCGHAAGRFVLADSHLVPVPRWNKFGVIDEMHDAVLVGVLIDIPLFFHEHILVLSCDRLLPDGGGCSAVGNAVCVARGSGSAWVCDSRAVGDFSGSISQTQARLPPANRHYQTGRKFAFVVTLRRLAVRCFMDFFSQGELRACSAFVASQGANVWTRDNFPGTHYSGL